MEITTILLMKVNQKLFLIMGIVIAIIIIKISINFPKVTQVTSIHSIIIIWIWILAVLIIIVVATKHHRLNFLSKNIWVIITLETTKIWDLKTLVVVY